MTQQKYNKRTGFTLIELLVVIAIIGILSAVVLASLSTARQKGSDAAAKENLLGPRAQGELFYYANGNSYNNGTLRVCDVTPASGGVKSINQQVLAAAITEGVALNIVNGTGGSTSTATCHDTATAWAAEIPLKAGGMFCVDSTGAATTTVGSTLPSGDAACGP